MASSSNETSLSISPNKLQIICPFFERLCNDSTLQSQMREFQSLLSNYIDSNLISTTLKYTFDTQTRVKRINISNIIKDRLNIYTLNFGKNTISSGSFGLILKKNNSKIIKVTHTFQNLLSFFNIFNEFIIHRLLSLEVEKINSTINCSLKMNIPKIYDYTKKNKNVIIEMNYIQHNKTLSDYILEYPDELPTTQLFLNLDNLIKNYIKYLRILQNKFSFIHFDMHLNNILLNIDTNHNITQFYLIDFGESYIKINDYHFFGNISYYNTFSLVNNKEREYWKSNDIIYLLFNICGALFHKYECINHNIIGKTNFGVDKHRYELNIDKILLIDGLYPFIQNYFKNDIIDNQDIFIELFKKIFYIQLNNIKINKDPRLPTDPETDVTESFFKMIFLNYIYALDTLLKDESIGTIQLHKSNGTIYEQPYEVVYIFRLFNYYKMKNY